MGEKQPQGVSIEPIERTTRRSWTEWMEFMDRIGAADLDHALIAQKVNEELARMRPPIDNPGWWAQGITVAYEQRSGRRLPGQQPDGTFQMSVSRTSNTDMQEALEKWVAFAAADPEVSKAIATQPKTSGTDKRHTWRSKAVDGSSLMFTSEVRPSGKTALIMQQLKLPSHEANMAAKEFWAGVLDRFVEETG